MLDRIRVRRRSEIILAVFFGLIVCGLFFEQSLSLYTAPQADATRWYGDETWQMRQFQTQMQEGILRNPDAPQSSIFRNNGILPNSLWIDAALYGVPEVLFFPRFSPVVIGRTVTFVMAICLLVYAYWMQRRRGVAPWVSIAFCILLVANRAFFFASHSARYDLLIAFCGLISMDFLAHIFLSLLKENPLQKWEKLLLAAFPALCLAWNIHLVRIEFLPYLAVLIALAIKNYRKALSLIAANAVVVILLLIPALMLVSPWSLFHAGAGDSMLGQTFGNNPVLRVLSPSILRSTFVERLSGMQSEAPIALDGALLFVIVGIIILSIRNRSKHQSEFILFFFGAISFFSWAVTLRFVPYYGIHVLPSLVICASIVAARSYNQIWSSLIRTSFSMLFVGIVLYAAYESFEDAVMANSRGKIIAASTQRVVSEVVTIIHSHHDSHVPTVLTVLQLQNNLLPMSGIHTINSLYQEYPDSVITLVQFLEKEGVDYILDVPRSQEFAELAGDTSVDSLVKASPKFLGHFSDWKFDYFKNDPLRTDTLVLYSVVHLNDVSKKSGMIIGD